MGLELDEITFINLHADGNMYTLRLIIAWNQPYTTQAAKRIIELTEKVNLKIVELMNDPDWKLLDKYTDKAMSVGNERQVRRYVFVKSKPLRRSVNARR